MSQSDESLGTGQGSPTRKDVGTVGREDGQGSEGTSGGGHVTPRHRSQQPASVVIRATVEHVGLVGDTELTVNVKWPASIFCVQPCAKPAVPSGQASDSQNVPANGPDASNFQTLFGEAGADPAPLEQSQLGKLKSEIAKLAAEKDCVKVQSEVQRLAAEHTGS